VRSRLRTFAIVGLIATSIDVGLYLLLRGSSDAYRTILLADLVALLGAALASYVLNRSLTFRGARNARWVSQPLSFAVVAALAGLVDASIVVLLQRFDAAPLVGKAVAVAVAVPIRWLSYRWVLFTEVRSELSTRHDRHPPPGAKRLSVVVPAFNEGSAIATTVERLRRELAPLIGDDDLEIVVVDDGSSDDTAAIAASAGARVLVQARNQGKGAAVRAGVLAASGRSVIFTDADLAYPPSMVPLLLTRLEDGWDVVVGSRRHEETTTLVRARRVRELGGRMVNWLTRLVLLGHFRDTQCGIKGFRSDIGRAIFERTTIDGFAFDIEVFLIAEQDLYSLTEVPVSVENREGSSVRLVADTLALLKDLVRIRRAAGRGAYEPDDAQRRLFV
jgi:putative flippase GtrA